MENKEHLYKLTKELYTITDIVLKQFQETKATGVRGDFYKTVKPFADEIKKKLNIWRELSLQWIKTDKPKYIFEQQIESVYEQIEMLSIQAFYPETSKSRFLQYLQSVRYILSSMLKQLSSATKE